MKILSQSPRDPAFVADPFPFYERARQAGVFFHWDEYGFACAAGWEALNAVMRDRRFGRERPGGPPHRPAHMSAFYALDDHSMLEREPPAHTRLRRLVLRAFTSRRIAVLEGEVEALAERLIDDFVGPEIDLLQGFAERLPIVVITRLLGVPEARVDDLRGWSNAMVAVYQARRNRAAEDEAEAAARALASFLRDCIAERRAAPGDDLLSALIAAEEDGERLSEPELVATCALLLNAGHEATANAIGNAVALILGRALEPDRLFQTEQTAAALVEELLRFDPPLHMFTRYVLEDAEVLGQRFRRGEVVGLLLAAAGRDSRRCSDPERFDPRRFEGLRAEGHVAFGAGIHFCVGASLARLEMRVGLRVLFRRLPGMRLAAAPRHADRYHFRGLERLAVRICGH